MKNKIEDVRNHLFATIEALLDEENPMDIERAKTVAEVAQVIVNSAKVEVDFIKSVTGIGSGFIPTEPRQLESAGPIIMRKVEIINEEPEKIVSEFDKAVQQNEVKTQQLTSKLGQKPIYSEYQDKP